MQTQQFITAETCCEHYNIDFTFINSLHDLGLIEVLTIEEKKLISDEDLPELEKFIHLHYDLDINIAGIDAIKNLLQRIQYLQDEIISLKNKLQVYE